MDGSVVKGKEAEEICAEAREFLKLAVEAEADNRDEGMDDLRFIAGEQWADDAKKVRKNRPCLTVNKLPQFIRQVVNEQRKTRPAIEVIPADANASKPTADVVQGLIRHIERTSRAQIAYDTAFEYAVSCGIGHFRITTDYYDDATFEQDICIKRIDNPFTVYRDPDSHEADHSDDNKTIITELVDPEVFEAKYGLKPSSVEDVGRGDDIALWFEGKRIRVAEYWRRVSESVEIHALATGQVIEGKLPEGVKAVKSRTAERKKVEQYLLTCDKVVKKSEWAGRYIPVVTCIGAELNIEGKKRLFSLIRFAKDPARMYNYMRSAEIEMIALQPKAPFIAPEGSFRGHESQWGRANTENLAYLEYKPVPNQPGPQRQPPPQMPAAFRDAAMASDADMKATMGMYDASLGARSNETSGVAIKARREEGDTATFHFIDNHARAIEHAGRIIIDLIPKVYDTPRMVRILGDQDEEQMVAINQMFIDPNTGQEVNYDLALGKYEVAVRVGPSFESKRQEMVQSMIELAQSNPQLMQIAGDLVVKNMDWPESEKIAERIKAMQQAQQSAGDPNQKLIDGQAQVEQIKAQAAMQKAQADANLKAMDGQLKQMDIRLKELELEAKQHELGIQSQMQERELGIKAMEITGAKAIPGTPEHEEMMLQDQMECEATARRDATMEALVATVAQSVQTQTATAQLLAEAVKVMSAPKKTVLRTDSSGRPVESVTQPVI